MRLKCAPFAQLLLIFRRVVQPVAEPPLYSPFLPFTLSGLSCYVGKENGMPSKHRRWCQRQLHRLELLNSLLHLISSENCPGPTLIAAVALQMPASLAELALAGTSSTTHDLALGKRASRQQRRTIQSPIVSGAGKHELATHQTHRGTSMPYTLCKLSLRLEAA